MADTAPLLGFDAAKAASVMGGPATPGTGQSQAAMLASLLQSGGLKPGMPPPPAGTGAAPVMPAAPPAAAPPPPPAPPATAAPPPTGGPTPSPFFSMNRPMAAPAPAITGDRLTRFTPQTGPTDLPFLNPGSGATQPSAVAGSIPTGLGKGESPPIPAGIGAGGGGPNGTIIPAAPPKPGFSGPPPEAYNPGPMTGKPMPKGSGDQFYADLETWRAQNSGPGSGPGSLWWAQQQENPEAFKAAYGDASQYQWINGTPYRPTAEGGLVPLQSLIASGRQPDWWGKQ